jgi:membrane protein
VVVLLWIYYSSQILFFGAEFTQVYARRYGSRIEPSKNAQWVPGREMGEKKKKEGAEAPSETAARPVSSP